MCLSKLILRYTPHIMLSLWWHGCIESVF